MIDGRSCADTDECKDNPRICSGGICSNVIGSYSCKCTNGLLSGPDSSSCVGKKLKLVFLGEFFMDSTDYLLFWYLG